MRIVFMGSSGFAVPSLERLVRDGWPVVAVYTQPDRPAGRGRALLPPPVKLAAARLGLPVRQPEKLNTDGAVAALAALKPEVIVVCAYGQILSRAVIDIPPRQCLNVHFSRLPRHRGAAPVAAAILAGDAFTGVTIQLVRQKLDTGPLLAAASVPVMPPDTTLSLTEKLALVGGNLLAEALSGWIRGERQPVEQDESRSSYFRRINKASGRIDWSLPAVTIWRQVRAYYPWPGCYTTWRGKQLKITGAGVMPGGGGEPGTVIAVKEPEGFGVLTGEGVLRVLTVQMEGKRELSAAEFRRGHRDFIGVKLPG